MMEITNNGSVMVTIQCCAYNHELYIRQCLAGIVMQRTSFRFEAIVHDDASKDGTVRIIKEFEHDYPDIIKPIYETENQYSKKDRSLDKIMDSHTHGKYLAICEGDDYWTDPFKLQKQFDYMEAHPECSMCFHSHSNLYPDGSFHEVYAREHSEVLSPKDIIMIADGVISTNSIFCRWDLRTLEVPAFWANCPVGDIPIRLYYASKGNVGFLHDIMSVYRVAALGSWSSQKRTTLSWFSHQSKIIDTFREYDIFTEKKYHSVIRNRIRQLYVEKYVDALRSLIKSWLPKSLILFYRRLIYKEMPSYYNK